MDREAGAENQVHGAAHVLMIPYLIQGHLNPILQFSKRLASKGLTVTLVIPSTSKKFSIDSPTSSNIRVEQIWDGVEEGENIGIDARLERFESTVSRTLSELIQRLLGSDCPPKVLVYDSVMPFALDIALQHGLHGAPFFTQPCAVNAVYYLVHQGMDIPIRGSVNSAPALHMLEESDLPSMVTRDIGLYPVLLKLIVGQFSNFQKAKWHFVNSFMELEEEVVNWLRIKCPILTIGPTIPSIYLDKRIEDDRDYGLSLFKPDGAAYVKWLDSKEAGSVIYVSFGSLASIEEEQMEEIAWGLKSSKNHFLWVVRETEKEKLPINFVDETAEQGLVVNWCSQLEVLSHKAVGCFMTHCGWNSTLEALSLGVPMVAMPQWTDQPTNAKFIADVWKVGIKVKVDEKGIGRKEEIAMCVKEMIEGEKGKEIRKNSLGWREVAEKSLREGGSSDKNIDEFVASFSCP